MVNRRGLTVVEYTPLHSLRRTCSSFSCFKNSESKETPKHWGASSEPEEPNYWFSGLLLPTAEILSPDWKTNRRVVYWHILEILFWLQNVFGGLKKKTHYLSVFGRMESYANYQLHFSILYTSESMSAINIPGKFHANRQNKRASFQTRTYSTDLPEQFEQFQKADVLNCSFIENFKDTNSSVFTKLQIHFTNQRTKQTR